MSQCYTCHEEFGNLGFNKKLWTGVMELNRITKFYDLSSHINRLTAL